MSTGALPVLSKHTYCNPPAIDFAGTGLAKTEAYSNADPYLLKFCGGYYCYSTGVDGVHVLYSQDLVQFTHLGYALQAPGEIGYWAPCVYYHNGIFYMYYSSNLQGEDDDHCHMLKLATSRSPQGSFTYVKQFTDVFAIDPHLVRDAGGQLYMFYSLNTPTGVNSRGAGTSIVVDRMLDFTTMEGDPKPVILPSLEEEIFQRNRFGDGRDWHTVEGAFYLEKHGRAYVMYSGNAFLSPNYFVGYSSADKTGPMDALNWKKHPGGHRYAPLIAKTSEIMGTGHNSVVKAPNNVDDWILYHGRRVDIPADDEWAEVRIMRADPLLWGDGCLLTSAPTHTEQDAPALPAFRTLFDDGLDGLDPVAGDWSVQDGRATQSRHNVFSSLIVQGLRLHNSHTEAWLRWERHHMGGRYGVYAAYESSSSYVAAQLHVGEGTIQLFAVSGGIAGPVYRQKLPAGFDFTAWHKLSITRTGSHFSLWVDDICSVSADLSAPAGTVGLFGAYTAFQSASLEVTDYLALTAENGSGFLSGLEGSSQAAEAVWQLQDDTLVALPAGQERALFRYTPREYRFSAIIGAPAVGGEETSGIYAAYIDDENFLIVLIGAKNQQLRVVSRENGVDKLEFDLSIAGDTVSLLVKKQGDSLFILADEALVYSGKCMPGELRCGFLAEGFATYSGIELLGL